VIGDCGVGRSTEGLQKRRITKNTKVHKEHQEETLLFLVSFVPLVFFVIKKETPNKSKAPAAHFHSIPFKALTPWPT
jgi:hypothetical protein